MEVAVRKGRGCITRGLHPGLRHAAHAFDGAWLLVEERWGMAA